ncbi:hypothetical protein P4H08_29535, partial [Bacillus cereus]|nr:hypothetical protein [Bacillus cereus]
VLPLTYFPLLTFFLRFAFLIFLNLQHTAISFPDFFFLHFFCALLSLTLQLATGYSSSYLFLLTYIPFALYFP